MCMLTYKSTHVASTIWNFCKNNCAATSDHLYPQNYVTKVINVWHDNLFKKSNPERLMGFEVENPKQLVAVYCTVMNKPHEWL